MDARRCSGWRDLCFVLSDKLLGVLDELSQGSGRVIISSSSPKQRSWIKPGATNSIFGTHLLAGLNGHGIKAIGNTIGILDLFTYLSEVVPIDAEALGVSQHPEMKAYSMNRNFPIAMLLGGKALSPSITLTSAIRTREISYNTATIRTLLKEALSDQELHELCMDHFPVVYDQFSLGMTKPQKISSLIEYCKRHNEFPHLLELIRPINLEKYAEYESRLRDISLHVMDPQGLSPAGDVSIQEQFKQKLDDLINWLPRLRGGLQLVLNSFDQYIMPSDCDTLKTRLTRDCVPVHKFAHFLTQSDDVPLEVIPHRFGLMNALMDFNNQVMAIEKSVIQFCDEYTVPQNLPVKLRREIQLQLENLLESRKIVVDEAEKLRGIIDR